MKIGYEYVMSGLGYTRIKGTHLIDWTYHKFERDFHDSKFAILYNAFTEAEYGRRFKDVHCNVYADSGGLQMMTRNLGITPELKDKVYQNQSDCSQFAMCFDEIPLRKAEDKGKIGSQQGRFFDRTLIKEKATETALNIRRQIELFEETGTEARPVAIIQGNCAETMLEWADVLFDQVGDKADKIASVAISGICIGNKTMEELERSFVFSQIHRNYKIDHLHLLGVGSVNRVSPFVVFDRLLERDILISYDSTSHVQSTTYGYHFWEEGLVKIQKGYYHKWDDMAARIAEFSEGTFVVDGPELYKLCNTNIKGMTDEQKDKVRDALFMMAAIQAYKMSDFVERTCKDFESSLIHHDQHLWLPLRALHDDVSTVQDFNQWRRDFQRYIPTSRVSSSHNSLDDLFG
ncbi:hypothetical protein Bhz51_00041 [Stenotrophomonas phage vB_SmaM_Bhz51]